MIELQTDSILQEGKYRIVRMIGQGGFGITYLAVQIPLNRMVAIKEFFMKDFCSRDAITQSMTSVKSERNQIDLYKKKFVKEAKNLARLHHPNIITVLDVFEENNTVYYVMPNLANGSLQELVKLNGILPECRALKYVKQVALALKYMHEEHQICHYDVKPANILIDDNDNAVLIDFGISKNYDIKGYETTTTPIGISDGFSPLEQYQQNIEVFSPSSDIYSLGATLYFLLHGNKPVSAVQRAEGVRMLINDNISPVLKSMIKTSMVISRRNRPQNMEIFWNANIKQMNKASCLKEENTVALCADPVTGAYQTFKKEETDGNKNNRITICIIFIIIGVTIAIGLFLNKQQSIEPVHIEKASYQDYFDK